MHHSFDLLDSVTDNATLTVPMHVAASQAALRTLNPAVLTLGPHTTAHATDVLQVMAIILLEVRIHHVLPDVDSLCRKWDRFLTCGL